MSECIPPAIIISLPIPTPTDTLPTPGAGSSSSPRPARRARRSSWPWVCTWRHCSQREHGEEIQTLAGSGKGFGIVAGTGTGKTLGIRPIAESLLGEPLRYGVVNREREATPETPSWNVVIVTTGIARRWFQDDLITGRDTVIVDEIHQTSAELELCLALGKRAGCRYIWLSATVDPAFYARYLGSADVLETYAFDPALRAKVQVLPQTPEEFLSERFIRHVMKERRGVAVFVPTRAEVERLAVDLSEKWKRLTAAFYHGGDADSRHPAVSRRGSRASLPAGDDGGGPVGAERERARHGRDLRRPLRQRGGTGPERPAPALSRRQRDPPDGRPGAWPGGGR